MKGRAFITLFAVAALAIGCSGTDKPGASSATTTTGAGDGKPVAAPGALKDLKIEDLEPGKGEGAKEGDTLTMLYRGTLANGTVFDGNMDDKLKPLPDKEPFGLFLGMGTVIQGWEKGLVGIKAGGVRKLSIPATMGYGAQQSGQIPPNSDLYFTVKCLDIVRKGEEMVIDTNDVKVGAGAEVKKGDKVTVHYVGKLLNDKQFDSSREGNKPLSFTVGNGEVVPGFEKGVMGMKKGGIRKVKIPPAAAYGANPQNGMPPNAVLLFEIEVLKINGK